MLHGATSTLQGEDINEFHERNRRNFEDSISDYPLLGRIFDMYEDAVYEASEVEALRSECLKVRNQTDQEDSIRAANKIMLSCNKACEGNLGLRFISD